ncbi:hypothetical protein PRUB_b0489 [Pseudoalteromonas rubra]|uniref:Uncharacterized protein n=1 Tax=Pseudoalteromonas rubra TaxID=43658 RepID=A0A8T0BZC4_9GAMM|nr:hypothetical protein PRUB_b0489 [Pseudoalteromonas rubra]
MSAISVRLIVRAKKTGPERLSGETVSSGMLFQINNTGNE